MTRRELTRLSNVDIYIAQIVVEAFKMGSFKEEVNTLRKMK